MAGVAAVGRSAVASRSKLERLLVVSGVGLGALTFVATSWLPAICPARVLFHIPCPSCGLTRAARALLHGDIAAATALHPLWWLVFPYLGVLGALEATTYVQTGQAGRWTDRPLAQRLGVGLLVLLVVVWGARAFGAFGGPVALD